MTRRTGHQRLTWTPLGIRMGFTSEASQRAEILAATDRMTWSDPATRPPDLDSPVVRGIAGILLRRHPLSRVGVAELLGARRLIGLQDTAGICCYVLDRGTDAIYLLTEAGAPPAKHRHRVA